MAARQVKRPDPLQPFESMRNHCIQIQIEDSWRQLKVEIARFPKSDETEMD